MGEAGAFQRFLDIVCGWIRLSTDGSDKMRELDAFVGWMDGYKG